MYEVVWTPEKEKSTIEYLTKYFAKHGPGECIMQDDNAIFEAPRLLASIADEILIEEEGLIYKED